MVRESTIRSNAKKILEKDGYIVWCPPNVKYAQTDIFGIFDGVAVKKGNNKHTASELLLYIQWTTKPNISARRKKILAFFEENFLHIPCEIWGWDDKKKEFKIEQI